MSKIKGKKESIKRVMEAKAGDPSVYVNLEIIDQLPDEYESVIVEIEYDIKKDFTNVGSDTKPSFYPTVFFMNDIADKCGISGYGKVDNQTIYEEVNESVMEMASTPVIMKRKCGYMVTKVAAALQEDGTLRPGSARTGICNAWQECVNTWTKEEMYTEGYTKDAKYPSKYDTKWKRRLHFQNALDKAYGMADSKAWSKCVREYTGMQTGYSPEDLKEGKFYFSKIRRSELAIKTEAAARYAGLSQGQQQEPVNLLFAPTDTPQEPVNRTPPTEPDPFAEDQEPEKTNQEKFIETLESYISNNLIPENFTQYASGVLTWLKKLDNAETADPGKWSSGIDRLKNIEAKIPEEGRINHGLY